METATNYTLNGIKKSYAIHAALLNYYPVIGEIMAIIPDSLLLNHFVSSVKCFNDVYIFEKQTCRWFPVFGSYKEKEN